MFVIKHKGKIIKECSHKEVAIVWLTLKGLVYESTWYGKWIDPDYVIEEVK